MFCEKCGKAFDGEGTLCDVCAAEAAAVAVNDTPPAEPAPVQAVDGQQAPTQMFDEQQNLVQIFDEQQNPLPAASDQQDQPASDAQDAPEVSVHEEDPFTLSTPAAPAKKKKKLNGKIIGIIAAVLALVGGTCFFFFFTDAGKYMASSPEEYLQDVQQEEISTYVDGATALYGAFLDAPKSNANAADVRVQAGDAFFELAEAAGIPADQLNWLRDIRLNAALNKVNSTLQTNFRFALGETEIAQADVIFDMLSSRLYMALPGLNNQYLSAAFVTGNISLNQNSAAMDKLREELPSERAFRNMLNTFVEAALNEIVNVQKAEQIVMVDGVSEKQHVLTASITEGDALRMVKAILETAQNNETFKELLTAVTSYANMMGAGVNVYSEVMKEIPLSIAQLTAEINSYTSGSTIVLKTFVNHSGKITGRIVTVFSSGPAQEILNYLSATEDGVTKIQGNVNDFYFSGQKQTSGKITTGKYTFYMRSEEMFTLDVTATKNQSTEFRLTPGKAIVNLLLGRAGLTQSAQADAGQAAVSQPNANPLAGLLAGSFSFSMTVSDPDADAPAVSFGAQLNGKSLITVSIGAKEQDAQSITLPQSYVNAEDEAAFEAWYNDLDISGLIGKLRSAGVPEELVDSLESLLKGAQSQTAEALPAA